MRTQDELDSFVEYEQWLLKLKTDVFKAGYNLTIDSKSGKLFIYGHDDWTRLKTFATSHETREWLAENNYYDKGDNIS